MRFKLIISLSFAVLAGCGKAGEQAANIASDATFVAEKAAPLPPNAAQSVAGSAEPKAETPKPPTIITPMLAYTYASELLVPSEKLPILMNTHKANCEKAGSQICQIVNSNLSNNDGSANGVLVIRAEPKFLGSFRDKLGEDAKNSGGKITSSTVSSEDLTRQITDNEARLRALTTLRTRVEGIIATRPGKLSDLLEAEQELARVQGEIDTMNSEIALAKGRVAMSEMTLNYHSNYGGQQAGVFSELQSAFSEFFMLMFGTIAQLVRVLAVILPIGLVVIPLFVFIRKYLANRPKKETPPKSNT
ncbi:MAG: DUF4349 domain-containing protein [Caulobacterales bacterium]|nr:DUF4349 domain-containing protein [Caulobacterales bacterium]MCA0373264.1 DUF4349 domain-containing protein [Pseudomonadota bacterium]